MNNIEFMPLMNYEEQNDKLDRQLLAHSNIYIKSTVCTKPNQELTVRRVNNPKTLTASALTE